jgi:NAD(P)H-quinone oxidoreductase subunit 4
LLTQMYDATTVQLTARLRDSVPTLAATKAVQNVSLSAPIIGN